MKTFCRLASVAVVAILLSSNGIAGTLLADLSITKDDGVANATPGTQITYTIVASNAGPNDAPGTTVTDTFPAALTCSWTCTASAGSSCTAAGSGDIADLVTILVSGNVTFTATCDIDPAATGNLANTATVTEDASVTDNNQANNTASDTDTLVPSADLAITKSSAGSSVTPGSTVTYSVVATNNGPSAVTDAAVSDNFPAALQNCSWTSTPSGGASGNTNGSGNLAETLDMPAGSSVTYDITCDIDAAATGTLDNTASISSATVGDPTAGNDSATESDTLAPSADLSITKSSAASSVVPGTTATYTIVATNSGPSVVTDANVTDTFPADLQNCSWTSTPSGGATGNTSASGNLSDTLSMPVGSSVTYDVTCDVDAAATGSLDNTASIASATASDPNAGNDSATESDALGAEADLSISKTDNTTEHTAGMPLDYVIVVGNNGPSAVSDAEVMDNFQAPLQNCTWTSAATGGATGNSSASGALLNDVLDMPVGSTVTYNITCDTDPSAVGTVSNTATVNSASATDPNAGNDSETDGDTALRPPVPVPAVSTWTLLVLAGFLALLGAGFIWRRTL